MISKTEYEKALKIVSEYKKQQKKSTLKVCNHYNTDWNIEEQRYICLDCGNKGPKKGEK